MSALSMHLYLRQFDIIVINIIVVLEVLRVGLKALNTTRTRVILRFERIIVERNKQNDLWVILKFFFATNWFHMINRMKHSCRIF